MMTGRRRDDQKVEVVAAWSTWKTSVRIWERARTTTVLLWGGLIWTEAAEIQKKSPEPAVVVAALELLSVLVHMKAQFVDMTKSDKMTK